MGYDNTGLKVKTKGFYGVTEVKCSVLGSTAYEKKFIPGPNAYESRGKSMGQILNEKKKAYLYQYQPKRKPDSGVKWRKTKEPGPTYDDDKAREKSASMKNPIKISVPRAKNASYLSTILRTKKQVPGVGSYKTLETDKQLAKPINSLKMRRH